MLACMNMMNNVLTAWLPLIVWKQVDAPRYHKGFITASCTSALFVAVSATVAILQKRDNRRWVFNHGITSQLENPILIFCFILGRVIMLRMDLLSQAQSQKQDLKVDVKRAEVDIKTIQLSLWLVI